MLAAPGDSKKSEPSTSASASASIDWSQPCRSFEFPEILLATDNFDESLVIGHGGFGKVFKGNITNGSSVTVAAIKRLDSSSSQGETEFWTEVEMLSKLRHCHIVSLLGYCNYEKEMILIYEYMPNGTLEDHLHKLGTPLSWLQRLNICIGTARGLDYLHTGTGVEFGVIHRDVKTSNILLHEKWAAKVSDFGLSKIGPINQRSTYVKTLVKGTFGYHDPNYFNTGRLTRKSDVYSFGVVLLEVLCRKRAVDGSVDEEWGLATWAQESIKEGNLKNIIDSGITGQISTKCLKEFVRIAKRCLHNNPKQRPTMAEVVVGLHSVLTLQQKANRSLEAPGRTIYGKLIRVFQAPNSENLHVFPLPFHGDNSGHVDPRLPDNKENSRNDDDNQDFTIPVPSLKVFKFDDLKRITENFSKDFLIDKDPYGEVFIGWVDEKTFSPSTKSVGIAVSVKRYSDRLPEWEMVVTSFGRLAHPNIISLLGYCSDKKHKGLLVYEHRHMRNRNFSHFLYENVSEPPLSWGTRLRIMIGVARGLAYLHSSEEKVVHGAIKTSNIYLDQNFYAKLGHFALAKCDPEMWEFDDTRHDMDDSPYISSEDRLTGHLTLKCDIYSFGVVLFETLTRQRAFKPKHVTSFTLVDWARPFLEDRSKIKYIVDHRLEQNYPQEGAFRWVALATRCVAKDSRDRPSSEEVMESLEQICLESLEQSCI